MSKRPESGGSLRAAHSRLTRCQVLDAARQVFVERGYPGTTLAAVAREAGVSVQTIYNVVGGKAAVIKAVYDATLVGDDDPVPMAQRPAFRAVMDAPDARSCLSAYAAIGAVLGQRLEALLPVLLAGAAAGDPDLVAFVDVIEDQRATGTATVATHVADRFGLRADLDVDEAATILWALTAPETANRLVARRGWSWSRYEQWLATAMADALVGPS